MAAIHLAANRPATHVAAQNGDLDAILRLKMALIPRFLRPQSWPLFRGPRRQDLWCAQHYPDSLRIDL